jgi:pimeloyl-ACP methyl ester carboxylesterase
VGELATVIGSGPSRVLVLHGWCLDSSVWQWATPLVDGARYSYALVDFPGYGKAHSAEPAVGMDAMAQSALGAADELGWSKFSVLGHSMGGTTALRLASLAPERVERICALTPVGASGFPVDSESYQRFEGAWPEAGWVLEYVSPELNPERVQELLRLSKATMSKPTWSRYLANWTGASFVEAIQDLPTPTTFVLGERDPIGTPDHLADTISALGRAEVVTLPNAAHYPMVERPEQSVEAWEEALSRPVQDRAN